MRKVQILSTLESGMTTIWATRQILQLSVGIVYLVSV